MSAEACTHMHTHLPTMIMIGAKGLHPDMPLVRGLTKLMPVPWDKDKQLLVWDLGSARRYQWLWYPRVPVV